MTSEIQTFIKLTDLIGLRFECGNCHQTTAVRLSSESKVLHYEQGFKCPHCYALWFQGPQDSRQKSLLGFIADLRDLMAVKQMPFDLRLEIATPLPALAHASDSKV